MGPPGEPGRDGAPAPYGEKGKLEIKMQVHRIHDPRNFLLPTMIYRP